MLLVSSKEENEILNILNCMSIFLIKYFIVDILDHVDHENLPRDVFVCCTVYYSTTKNKFFL